MAKYTELYIDYVNGGGEVPTADFALIEGFDTLFLERFCDREIGFETESAFAIKLAMKAKLVMQPYADRIALRTNYLTKAGTPTKTIYETNDLTSNMGAQKSTTTELPIDSANAEPNLVSDINAYENTDNREVNRTESGVTPDEVIHMLEYLNRDVGIIIEKCLNEFEPLFMQVY